MAEAQKDPMTALVDNLELGEITDEEWYASRADRMKVHGGDRVLRLDTRTGEVIWGTGATGIVDHTRPRGEPPRGRGGSSVPG
jgi:hypothetical protein